MLSQVKFLDFAWSFFKYFFQNNMSFLTAHSAGETVGPEDTPEGKGGTCPPRFWQYQKQRLFPQITFYFFMPPSPRFFGPTDASDSNNIDFYKFWQDVKLLVFSSKSPKQSHRILF